MKYHLIREDRRGQLSLVECYDSRAEADHSKRELDRTKGLVDDYWIQEVKECSHEK